MLSTVISGLSLSLLTAFRGCKVTWWTRKPKEGQGLGSSSVQF